MFCIHCGVDLPDFAAFCSKCGNRVPGANDAGSACQQENKTSGVTGKTSYSPQISNQFKEEPRPGLVAPETQISGASTKSPRGTYKWALVYGWFTIAAAAYLLFVAALKLLGVQDSMPSPSLSAHAQSIGTASAMFQGLVWLATGLAILQRRLIAIRLMWVVVILAGLGVLLRGIVPLDLLMWILSVAIAKWFSTKREFLSERGGRGVEIQRRHVEEALVKGHRDHWWGTLQRKEGGTKPPDPDERNRGFRILLYLAILFGGVIFADWAISALFQLPSEDTYQLTKTLVTLTTVVAVLGLVFARRWLSLKTSLITTVVISMSFLLLVVVARNHSDSRVQAYNQTSSAEQPKIDYLAVAKQMGGAPVASAPVPVDLSGGLVPKQPEKPAQPAEDFSGWTPVGEAHPVAAPAQPGQSSQAANGFDFGFGAQPTQLTGSELKDLQDTFQWLKGASDSESATGIPPYQHYTFESGGENGCSVAITETRAAAGPEWWIKESFSLAEIDPADIQVNKLGKGAPTLAGESAVRFHTTNYRETIVHTSNSLSKEILTSDYTVFTNDWFAPRFARALKHAAKLCGAKTSSF